MHVPTSQGSCYKGLWLEVYAIQLFLSRFRQLDNCFFKVEKHLKDVYNLAAKAFALFWGNPRKSTTGTWLKFRSTDRLEPVIKPVAPLREHYPVYIIYIYMASNI